MVYLTNGKEDLTHISPTSNATQYPFKGQWQIHVQSYRPEQEDMEYAIDPKKFSNNKFELELESEADYIARKGESRATRL